MSAPRLFPEQPSSSPLAVSTLLAKYLRHLEGRVKANDYSADHMENCRRSLNSFLRFIGEKLIPDCRQYDLTGWLGSNPAWKSACTKRNAIGAVLGCFAWAEDEEIISRCPYRRPRSLRTQTDKPRRPADMSEYIALMREGSKKLRQALFFLWWTGARTCEMRELTWESIRFDEPAHIWLEHHKTERKTGKPRVIALDPVVARFLSWMKARATGDFVFTNCDGTPWDRHSFARHLRRTAERIGLDDGISERVTGYCLRHSYACAAIEGGATSKQVADLLGHSDTKMVERVYGSHTSQHMDYLSRVANDVRRGRRSG